VLMSFHSIFFVVCIGSTENVSFQTAVRHNPLHSYILSLRLGTELSLCTCNCTEVTNMPWRKTT